MKVLVVGSGGREHALCVALAKSDRVTQLHCVPGNGGITAVAKCHDQEPGGVEGVVSLAKRLAVDLVVVGPEQPLTEGLADRLLEENMLVVGPVQVAAQLEGSKAFAKEMMQRTGIPTADFQVFTDPGEARAYVEGNPERKYVVKADGLAAGKGVILCRNRKETLEAIDLVGVTKAFGAAGDKIVVEEFLEGEEASFIALTDGKTILPFAGSQDHKAVRDNDQGPNTGGMGAYSPAPVLDEAMERRAMEEVMAPLLNALKEQGIEYRGFIYAGLMIDSEGCPKVLEFNVRLGDPETQPLLCRLRSDLAVVLKACAEGKLSEITLDWDPRPAVCVVMAAGGYPGSYEKGHVIEGIDEAEQLEDVIVYQAGTKAEGGSILANGGRVLGVTALGDDLQAAIDKAYQAVEKIHWPGVHFRRDIGRKGLKHLAGA